MTAVSPHTLTTRESSTTTCRSKMKATLGCGGEARCHELVQAGSLARPGRSPQCVRRHAEERAEPRGEVAMAPGARLRGGGGGGAGGIGDRLQRPRQAWG